MVSKTATVCNANGIHVRPSAVIAGEMKKCADDVWLEVDGERIDAKNILGLISLGMTCGRTITVGAEGPDEEQTCAKLLSLIETNFDFPPKAE